MTTPESHFPMQCVNSLPLHQCVCATHIRADSYTPSKVPDLPELLSSLQFPHQYSALTHCPTPSWAVRRMGC